MDFGMVWIEWGSIKMKIMAFQGKNNLEAYLEWKKKSGVDFLLSPLL